MEEQKEQLKEKEPGEMADVTIDKKIVVDEEATAAVRRKKTGGANEGAGIIRKAAITLGKTPDSEPVEEVISINRITKVTKGGKKLSFSALVVVGDTKGRVGYGLEKAAEVSIAIRKSIASAKKKMITVSLKGSTIPHEIIGRCGGATVLLKPAADGTGVIAAGPVRAVCDGVGIRNILTKCHRSNNPINVVKATMDGLSRLKAGRQAPLKE